VLAPKTELFLAGFQYDGEHQGLYDDGSALAPMAAPVLIDSDIDESWLTGQVKNNVEAADFDGDGRDEVALVYTIGSDLKMRYWDGSGRTYAATTHTLVGFPSAVSSDIYLDSGDLDGDGKSELLISIVPNFYVFTGLDTTSPTKRDERAFAAGWWNTATCGDFDGDMGLEIFLMGNAPSGAGMYSVYDGSLAAPLAGEVDQFTIFAGVTFRDALVACGDFDGDHIDEIAMNAHVDSGNNRFVVLDDARADFALLEDGSTYSYVSTSQTFDGLETLDIDGDGLDEILFYRFLVDDALHSYDSLIADNIGLSNYSVSRAVADHGDYNGDGKDDVYVMYRDSDGYNNARVFGLNSNGTLTDYAKVREYYSVGPQLSVICAPNADDDSVTVEYIGHELLFSEPKVIAVIASPPYHSDSGQTGCSASFGETDGASSTAGSSIGLSYGFSVGTKFGAAALGAETSVKLTVSKAFDWSSSQTSSYSELISYSSGHGEDKVVFTSIPFDVYYYEVIASPDSVDIGTTMHISIPRKAATYSVERVFFNDNNGDSLDIDSSVLGHTIGDVDSYPNTIGKNSLLSTYEGHDNGPVAVGVGSGSTKIGLNTTTENSATESVQQSLELSFESTIGGFTVGGSVGFQHGFSYTLSTSSTTSFAGIVGDIPTNSYDASKSYSFGLFEYAFPLEGQEFFVINFWATR
jgi:hypothetical protein